MDYGKQSLKERVHDSSTSPCKSIDISPEVVADLVGLEETDIDDRYPIKIANTGVPHLMVPVKTRQAIDQAEPKLNELKKMNNHFNISTTHLFTLTQMGNLIFIQEIFAQI